MASVARGETYQEFLDRLPESQKDTPEKMRRNLQQYREAVARVAREHGDTVSNPLTNRPSFSESSSRGSLGASNRASEQGLEFDSSKALGDVVKGTALSQAMANGSALAGTAQGAPTILSVNGVVNPVTSPLGAIAYPAAGAGALGASMYNYGGRDILKGEGDAGSYLDTALGSNPVTGWVNPLLDAFGADSVGESLGLGSGKDKAQKTRDAARDVLQRANIAEKVNGEHFVNTPKGRFSIGQDGGSRFQGFDGQTSFKSAFDVDTSHPLADKAVSLVDPISHALFDDPDVRAAMSIQLSNAVLKGANSEKDLFDNVRQIYADSGIKKSEFFAALDEAGLDEETTRIMKNSINQVQQSKSGQGLDTNPLYSVEPDTGPDSLSPEAQMLAQVENDERLRQLSAQSIPETTTQESAQFLDINNLQGEVFQGQNPLTRRI